jgi:hypothetical protein
VLSNSVSMTIIATIGLNNAEAYEYSRDCYDDTFTINVDIWLSHATVPGATRYGETGRTGWYTYVGDCNWHLAPRWAFARVDDPDWACAWAQVYGGGARDFMCVNNNTAPLLSPPLPSASQPSSDLPKLRGKVGDTLIASNGLQLTLLTTKRDGNLLLFHYHAYNGGNQAVSLIGSGADNQFYYVQSKKFTRTPGLTTTQRAKYGALPSTLAAGASADGWAAIVTTSKTQHAFDTVLYRFGAVPSMTCINPDDRATCHPDEAFQALIWNF